LVDFTFYCLSMHTKYPEKGPERLLSSEVKIKPWRKIMQATFTRPFQFERLNSPANQSSPPISALCSLAHNNPQSHSVRCRRE
jgi:hypothetical protein